MASKAEVIPWACPVPVFGNIDDSRVATLGLNPSNREFVDITGRELSGSDRRFHTLTSLNIETWDQAKASDIRKISKACQEYFSNNPYDAWFRELDSLINSLHASYYGNSAIDACHLDLIPYATYRKWTDLRESQRKLLLNASDEGFGRILKESKISLLILNGISVVRYFESVSDTKFKCKEMREWGLPRKNAECVPGISYMGYVTRIGKTNLERRIFVIGFNHNIQSSFGVTKHVKSEIRKWIGGMGGKAGL